MKTLARFIRHERSLPLPWKRLKQMVFRKNLRYKTYDKIRTTDTIRSLLPESESGLVVLFMDRKKRNSGVGHFVLLFRHPRSGIHFFDPLGVGLRKDAMLTGNDNRLLNILKHHSVEQNRIKYQEMAKDTQSCGRHVVMRYNAASLTPEEYMRLMTYRGIKRDDLVTLLTLPADLAHWFELVKSGH